VERYAVAVRTLPGGTGGVHDAAAIGGAGSLLAGSAVERVAAFGTTRGLAGLPPLPLVATELRRIVRSDAAGAEGVVPGPACLHSSPAAIPWSTSPATSSSTPVRSTAPSSSWEMAPGSRSSS